MNISSRDLSSITFFISPLTINLPFLIIAILLHNFSATSKTCVEKNIIFLSAAFSFNISFNVKMP